MTRFAPVTSIDELVDAYGAPGEASLVKVTDRITPEYRRLLEASPFFALATAGAEGLDCSPRGELGGAFVIGDDKTIIIPDRRGNNRLDSLRNIIEDGRVALLFLIPGSGTTLRLNGDAIVTRDGDLLASLSRDGKEPRAANIVTIGELYFQCARAVMRAGLWDADNHVDAGSLPSPGAVLKAQTSGGIDGETYDRQWPGRAAKTMW